MRDSVVVYVGDAGDAGASPAVSQLGYAVRSELTAGEGETPYFAYGLQGTHSTRVPGLERWHTEYRDRVITRTDTVYQDREVQIQLPPERYVPRFYKYGTIAGVLAAVWFIVRMVLKIRKRLL